MSLDIRIVPLDEQHDRAAFSCGVESVDRYLQLTSLSAQQRFLAGTKVATSVLEPSRILGYHTLVFHEYRDGELPPNAERKLKVAKLRRIPMLLLAQLGVRTELQGKGLGHTLLKHAFETCLATISSVGIVAPIADPIDAQAETLYAHYGFVRIQPQHPRMLIPMRKLHDAYTKGFLK